MVERDIPASPSVVSWARHFTSEALGATYDFFLNYQIGSSLKLTPDQRDVFLDYFAHYWVLKTNIEAARRAREPIYEAMLKVPVLNIVARNVYQINAGVDLAAKTFKKRAERDAARLQDNSHGDIRNAANILSSLYIEDVIEDEKNQKIDRALSRLKIGKSASG